MADTEKMIFPAQLHQTADGGIVVSKLDEMINLAVPIRCGLWFLVRAAVL